MDGPSSLKGMNRMRIAAFGDLHLSHASVLDKFKGQEETLLRFDEHLCQNHENIVIMGDVFQTDYGLRPGSRSEILERILERYPRIIRRWMDSQYRILFGNHDRITQKFLGTLKQIFLKIDGWRLWFIHGHQFDPFIGENKYPYVVSWMIGGMRRAEFRRLADFLEGPFYEFGQRVFRSLDLIARNELLLNRNDVVIMGHSHRLTCHPFGQGVYVNSGHCFCTFPKYVSIDTFDRSIELRSFIPPHGHTVIHRWTNLSSN